MGVSGPGPVSTVGAITRALPSEAESPAAAKTGANWFDMTAWDGPVRDAGSITLGARTASGTPVADLSADILSAVLR